MSMPPVFNVPKKALRQIFKNKIVIWIKKKNQKKNDNNLRIKLDTTGSTSKHPF